MFFQHQSPILRKSGKGKGEDQSIGVGWPSVFRSGVGAAPAEFVDGGEEASWGVPAGLTVSEWVRACLIFCAFFILAGTFLSLSLN